MVRQSLQMFVVCVTVAIRYQQNGSGIVRHVFVDVDIDGLLVVFLLCNRPIHLLKYQIKNNLIKIIQFEQFVTKYSINLYLNVDY